MHLPSIHSDEYSIDYESEGDGVDHGDCLYYAPDGTMLAVTAISRRLINFRVVGDGSTMTTHRDDVTDNLWTDFFPVTRT